MAQSRAVVFLDTNVLLHYIMFDECDWNALVGVNEVALALCPLVVRELDRKKFAETSQRTREKAARVVRKIGTLVSDSRPVQLREGLALWATCHEPRVDFDSMQLDRQVADDVLLACAIERYGCGDDDLVAIASVDIGVRLKANALGIRTVAVPDDWRMPDELDDVQRQLRATQAELAALKAAVPKLRLTFENGDNTISCVVRRRDAPSPEEVERSIGRLRRRLNRPGNPRGRIM